MKKHQNNHSEEIKTFKFYLLMTILGMVLLSFSSCSESSKTVYIDKNGKDSCIVYYEKIIK